MNWLIIFIILLLSTFAFAGYSFAPWVPVRKKDLERISKLANFKPNDTFYELGCGDGRVIFYIAKNFPIKAVGLEIAFPLYLICKLRQFISGQKNINIKYKSLFKENLSQADVIYFFGIPKNIKNKLKQKLELEAKAGARIISYVFPIEGWQPLAVDKPSSKQVAIYLYIK